MNLAQLKRIAPHGVDAWLWAIVEEAPRWGITTPMREAMWIGQFAVETKGFTEFEENLNYSAQGLANNWPNRFAVVTIDPATGKKIFTPTQRALELQHRPEAIANEVYASRMGNGSPETGDGWMYRGRGPQLTGRANYRAAGLELGRPLEEFPELVLRPAIGAQVMGWYWHMRGCNELADKHDIDGVTRAINGGLIGLDQRRAGFQDALPILMGA